MINVKSGKELCIVLSNNNTDELRFIAQSFSDCIFKLIESRPVIETANFNSGDYKLIIYPLLYEEIDDRDFSELRDFFEHKNYLENSDGFSVIRKNNVVYIFSFVNRGLIYGVHDFLEKNADILWTRGAIEYEIDCISVKDRGVNFCQFDYAEKSPFSIRGWCACGQGTEGRNHFDLQTGKYFIRNKLTNASHYFPEWAAFGLNFGGGESTSWADIRELKESKPEYFMTDFDGSAKVDEWVAFYNYYNYELAALLAQRFIEFYKTANKDNFYGIPMPDSHYFHIVQDGVVLEKQPFTTDEGNTVYPSDKNYKSTVTFNFYNRIIKLVHRVYPEAKFSALAYVYCENAPSVSIADNFYIFLAPIYADDRQAYTNKDGCSNKEIAENVIAWTKICKNVLMYTYWNSFFGNIYTRPMLEQVKESLAFFKEHGVLGVMPEGLVDCSKLDTYSKSQLRTKANMDMNEFCIWAMNKLFWNPKEDVEKLLTHYAKVVFKETAEEFIEYYHLIKRGFDSKSPYIWYPTGGDIYILQLIVEAGIADKVLNVLNSAVNKAVTPSVVSRWNDINEICSREINKYKNFVKEEGRILYCNNEEDLLSSKALNYRNNAESIWNKALPMTVLRNFSTMEFYSAEAKFECRMICNDKKWYILYSVYDDGIAEAYFDDDNIYHIKRQDGSIVNSYGESYFGGNELNKSIYYGYISGLKNGVGEFYSNDGSAPVRLPFNPNVKDHFYAHFSNEPSERYYCIVQEIPLDAIDTSIDDFKPYGSFCFYSDRYKMGGWMGFGLWCKDNFKSYQIIK